MKFWLPFGVGVAYFVTGYLHFEDREYGFGIMWCAYAVAQMGILLAARGV